MITEQLDRPEAPESQPGIAGRMWSRFSESEFFEWCVGFYRRHERLAPAVFFFGGVAWDATTLKRIDAWFDNAFLVAYLAITGVLVVVAALVEHGLTQNPRLLKYREWYPAALQFFLGALFSAYTVFYFQSASLSESSIFLVVLVVLLVANEFIHRKLVNLYLLVGLYYLAGASFFIFFLPVVLKVVNYWTFTLGGLLSALLVGSILLFLYRRGLFKERRSFVYAKVVVAGLFGLLNLFYLQNWIPPVPLALRHGGIYHRVEHVGDAYYLTYRQPPWYAFWVDSDEEIEYAEGQAVYCFAAVFAPTKLTQQIYHKWQYYDEARKEWVTTDRIDYRIVGWRDNGYRGFTYKTRLFPGRWRVDVETAAGQILGRIPFTIKEATGTPVRLTTATYE